jgi:hypothetical protein
MGALFGTLECFDNEGAELSAMVYSFWFQCALHLAAPFFDSTNIVSKLVMQMIKSDIGSNGD